MATILPHRLIVHGRCRKWRQRPDGYLRGDDVYDPGVFGKVLGAPGHHDNHHQHQQLMTPPRGHAHGALGRSASQPGAAGPGVPAAYYAAGGGCPHGAGACPVYRQLAADAGGGAWEECCGGAAGHHRLEHVYETAATGGGLVTRGYRPAAAIDLPVPGLTQTAADLPPPAAELFDPGRV